MANYTENTDINSSKFATKTSRYLNSKVVYYTENKLLTYTLYRKSKRIRTGKEKYALITSEYEFRPDKVSSRFYGTPDFWWKIMEVNNIKDILDFKAGLSIILPTNLL